MLISKTVMLIWRINITINIADIAIIGTLSNFAYLILLIIASDTITLSVNTRYGLNNPLRYNVAKINEMPGIGNPIKSFVSIFSQITLYLVNLKTPQITIIKLTGITIV